MASLLLILLAGPAMLPAPLCCKMTSVLPLSSWKFMTYSNNHSEMGIYFPAHLSSTHCCIQLKRECGS
ncbi:hypothetical protein KP509_20G010200 [Ceratopteris richardii]|uniref:Uncharacterized protein n=1 Tax=Ceratopteris richardii TaxID=49495 RepID=A0A8T2SFY9_CERRI|nr:hypothetical protein KP509_20G010200 [Ceratopteris richardii]